MLRYKKVFSVISVFLFSLLISTCFVYLYSFISSDCKLAWSGKLPTLLDGDCKLQLTNLVQLFSDNRIKIRDVTLGENDEVKIIFDDDYSEKIFTKQFEILKTSCATDDNQFNFTFSEAADAEFNARNFGSRILHQFFRSRSCKTICTVADYRIRRFHVVCENEKGALAGRELVSDEQTFLDTLEEFSKSVSIDVDLTNSLRGVNIEARYQSISLYLSDEVEDSEDCLIIRHSLNFNGFRNISFVQLLGNFRARIVFETDKLRQFNEAAIKEVNIPEVVERYIARYSIEVKNLHPLCNLRILKKFFLANKCKVAFMCPKDSSVRVFFANEYSWSKVSGIAHLLENFTENFSFSLPQGFLDHGMDCLIDNGFLVLQVFENSENADADAEVLLIENEVTCKTCFTRIPLTGLKASIQSRGPNVVSKSCRTCLRNAANAAQQPRLETTARVSDDIRAGDTRIRFEMKVGGGGGVEVGGAREGARDGDGAREGARRRTPAKCRHFVRTGQCSFGSNCNFLHTK